MTMNVLKRCSTCHEWKLPGIDFHKNKSRADGYAQWCKDCGKKHRAKQEARLKADNPEKKKERQKQLYANRLKNNPNWREIENARVREWRKQAKAKDPAEWSRKACFAARKSAYGITEDEFHDLLDSQNGCCAACGDQIKEFRGVKGPHVDHCHTTGRVRAILCFSCNTAEGYLKTPARALKLFHYMADNLKQSVHDKAGYA